MASTQDTAEPTTPLKLDEATLSLWETLRAAVAAEEDWLSLRTEVRRLAARLDGMERAGQRALTIPLRSVLARFREVVEACDEQRERLRLELQDLAWPFTSHAFNLRYDDRVLHTEGRPQSLSADRLLCVSARLGDLALAGRLLKNDGSFGKEKLWISLLRTPWTKESPAS